MKLHDKNEDGFLDFGEFKAVFTEESSVTEIIKARHTCVH
jgi:hypothetical protein